MHLRRFLPVYLILALLAQAAGDEIWSGVADVRFDATSTLHNFKGGIPAVPLRVTVKPGATGRSVSATSDVEVGKISTSEPKRDKSMWEMFQQAKHRFIKIEVNDAAEQALKPSAARAGSMQVVLNIAGRRGMVNGVVTNVVESAAATAFDLQFPVSLKAFQLDQPKAVGGLVKVGDIVQVQAHVTLKRDKAE